MSNSKTIKGRPDYYITPTRDFTKYVRDCEEKYWNKESAFDWNQDVKKNLIEYLENLSKDELFLISTLTLPMIRDSIQKKIQSIKTGEFQYSEDALKDVSECVFSNNETISKLLTLYSPLHSDLIKVNRLNDRLDILHGEMVDLEEQDRLGIIKVGIEAKYIETEAEREELDNQLKTKSEEIAETGIQRAKLKKGYDLNLSKLKLSVKEDQEKNSLKLVEDLSETESFVNRLIESNKLPDNPKDLSLLKDLIVKRQLRALKDIANHALVVEQSAIAPLTMGIIHYKRYREIQEALTTFINDEAKHSATFRRFLVEKLEAKEFISSQLIKGAERYMWVARFAPGIGMFLAVIIEAIGASYLSFFSKKEIMPDKLFRSISNTISVHDETRHMDLCVAIYNELFRTGSSWERRRNHFALKLIMKSVYGDKHDDHHLIQAFRAFGVESDVLYNYVLSSLSQQLTRVGVFVTPEKLKRYIGK
ncbi:hypothetical protein [Aegicerativicinus sediminis]|uniref:hypothetical protein n=1 Tax=Aegicerativicinus sediminis TaxID=2893202 RepID=UPI001E40D102|nr:hypothetical protein [Aegicerativicinus sediminis]